MTEMGMSPERQGWFAGVKAKVKDVFKRFGVAGAKEHFYKQNAELIKKATANLTPDQRQQAYADIEQEALASAKTDVAVHWGAAVVGTTAATLGLGMFSEPVRRFAATHGGAIGRGYENMGLRARAGLDRLLARFHFRRYGSGNASEMRTISREVRGRQIEVANLMRQIDTARKAGNTTDVGRLTERLRSVREAIAAAQDRSHVTGVFRERAPGGRLVERRETFRLAQEEITRLADEERILHVGKNMPNVRNPERLSAIRRRLGELRAVVNPDRVRHNVPIRGDNQSGGPLEQTRKVFGRPPTQTNPNSRTF